VLILNRSGIQWAQAAALSTCLPSLEELSIAGCGIGLLGAPETPRPDGAAAADPTSTPSMVTVGRCSLTL